MKNGLYYAWCRPCAAENQRLYRKANKAAITLTNRKQLLKRYQGMSIENFEKLKQDQNSLCGICLEKPDKLHVDHCHLTQKIRGLLCRACNTGIGLLKDNPVLLEKAIAYLRK